MHESAAAEGGQANGVSRRGFLKAAGTAGAAAAVLGSVGSLFDPTAAVARDSAFTRKGAGPMYWSSYGWQQQNGALDESVWQTNIDWLADGLASYGFVQACTDGWVGGPGTPMTANGYLTTFGPSWKHDWSYWAKYLADKGMQLGIYFNPLWVQQDAYDQNVPVINSRYHVHDIVGSIDYGQGTKWVDARKPGAEQWIKGYVSHFAATGAKQLKVDFIGAGIPGVVNGYEDSYGSAVYAQALQWIAEAAGDKILIALSMPNMFRHGAVELRYADMVRISDDPWQPDAWLQLSANGRGVTNNGWPTHPNSFDGFVDFSDLSAVNRRRGNRLILDGCFPRFANFNSDAERRFAVSLFAVAGSPISFADQHNTLGSSIWALQNSEILALNGAGFAGRPRARDFSANSEVWTGKLASGEWIVALFNRDSSPQPRSVDFASELGITGSAAVRDLWGRAELGTMTGFATNVPPHDVRVLKVSPGRTSNSWESLGTAGADGPAVTGQNPLNLAAFIRTKGGALAWQTWNGTKWNGWAKLGGPTGGTFQGKPAATSWADGRLDVVVRGSDNAVWHTWYANGAWSGSWESLGGYTADSPAIASWGSNRLDVFIRGGDGQLYQNSLTNSGWGSWGAIAPPPGTALAGAPAAASWGAGRLDVFHRGGDNAIWHTWYANGGWSGVWESLGGYSAGDPAAACPGSEQLSVVIHGGDDQLWSTEWTAGIGWSGWGPGGGPSNGKLTGDPAIACRPTTGRLDVLAAGTDGNLYRETT